MSSAPDALIPPSFGDLVDSPEFTHLADISRLPLVLGRGPDGMVEGEDLAGCAVLFIVGPDGTGKSVLVNAMVSSLLAKRSPDDVRLLLFDPTGVELRQYDGVPHLLAPPMVDDEQGRHAIEWLQRTVAVDRREALLAGRARNIERYREHTSPDREPMPYIVAVLEEAEVLLDEASVRESLNQITRLGPEVGVHLVISTGGVPLGELLPMVEHSRVAMAAFGRPDPQFMHAPDTDRAGGAGSVLYQYGISADAKRLDVVGPSDEDIAAIVGHWRGQGSPVYDRRLLMSRRPERRYEELDTVGERVLADHPGLDPRISRLHPSIRLVNSEGIQRGARVTVEVTNDEVFEWHGFEVAGVAYQMADGATLGSARKRFDRKLRPGGTTLVAMDLDTSFGTGAAERGRAGFLVGIPSIKVDGQWE